MLGCAQTNAVTAVTTVIDAPFPTAMMAILLQNGVRKGCSLQILLVTNVFPDNVNHLEHEV